MALIRFFIFACFIVGFIFIARTAFGLIKHFLSAKTRMDPNSRTIPFLKTEQCPACYASIRVSKTDENLTCPKCGTHLGRNKEGKLLIKLN